MFGYYYEGALGRTDWDRSADEDPGPYQPGWRREWFRRHRTRSADECLPDQPRLFAVW